MKRVFVILVVLLFIADSLSAQGKAASSRLRVSPCALSEPPKLRGFYLGQSVEEIARIVPGFREAYESRKREAFEKTDDTDMGQPLSNWRYLNSTVASEINYFYFAGDGLQLPDNDSDVNIVWFFFKDKLYAFGVYYADYDAEESARQFIKQLSAKTIIPSTGWAKLLTRNIDTPENRAARVMMTDVEAELRCNNFKIYLNAGCRNVPHLIVTDNKAEAELVRLEREIKLRKKKEEQERVRSEREKRQTLRP